MGYLVIYLQNVSKGQERMCSTRACWHTNTNISMSGAEDLQLNYLPQTDFGFLLVKSPGALSDLPWSVCSLVGVDLIWLLVLPSSVDTQRGKRYPIGQHSLPHAQCCVLYLAVLTCLCAGFFGPASANEQDFGYLRGVNSGPRSNWFSALPIAPAFKKVCVTQVATRVYYATNGSNG